MSRRPYVGLLLATRCLYVKLMQFSGIALICGHMGGGISALHRCAFCYMWNLFGVVVLHTSMMDWRDEVMWWVQSSENVRMSRRPYVVLLLATRCLYVKLMQCSGIALICGHMGGGISALHKCAFCYMWNLFGVVVLHTSMMDWRDEVIWWVQSSENVRMSRRPYVVLLLATRCLC